MGPYTSENLKTLLVLQLWRYSTYSYDATPPTVMTLLLLQLGLFFNQTFSERSFDSPHKTYL